MLTNATRGLRTTFGRAMLTAARTPISGPVKSVPAFSTTEPTGMSPPATRTSLPGPTAFSIVTLPLSTFVYSCGMTASAPAGIGAPVETRIAVPDSIVARAGLPARASSTSLRVTGAPVVSPAWSAKPSIVEQSNGGTGLGATASRASTRPSASSMSTSSASSRLVCSSSRRRASSIEILLSAIAAPR